MSPKGAVKRPFRALVLLVHRGSEGLGHVDSSDQAKAPAVHYRAAVYRFASRRLYTPGVADEK